MNFETFVKSFPPCKAVEGSKTAEYIYEKIIWDEQNRIKMAEFSDGGICALAAIVDKIEACAARQDSDLKIDDTVKQTVGRMIAEALEPLGYLPVKKRRIPKRYSAKYFKNAAVYERTGKASEKIVKRIEKL